MFVKMLETVGGNVEGDTVRFENAAEAQALIAAEKAVEVEPPKPEPEGGA